MKIAFFADSYRPQVNGLVTSMDTFAKHLKKRGHSVRIFAPGVPGYKDVNSSVRRFRSVEFPPYREYRISIPARISGRFDIIHVHSPFSAGISGLLHGRKTNTPVVGTFHTLFPEYGHYLTNLSFLKKPFTKLSWSYLVWFYNQCGCVTAPSAHIKKLLEKRGITKPVYVVPTGIEIRRQKKAASRNRGEKMILHVGRLTREKNINFIIASLAGLLKREKAVLVITSDGPYRRQLEAAAQKTGVGKKIRFTGYLSARQLRDIYSAADVFVVASKTETQGIVLIEAVANRLPIVALKAPVTADFLEENRYGIVSSRDEFADRVRQLIHDQKLRRQATKNSAAIMKKYSAANCASMMEQVYREAIRISSGSRA